MSNYGDNQFEKGAPEQGGVEAMGAQRLGVVSDAVWRLTNTKNSLVVRPNTEATAQAVPLQAQPTTTEVTRNAVEASSSAPVEPKPINLDQMRARRAVQESLAHTPPPVNLAEIEAIHGRAS